MRKMVVVLVLAVAASGCAASEFIRYKEKKDYPRDADTSIRLPGLADTVKVMYDRDGVPHVRATNPEDLARAAGFVQARDRFFQMDVLRRIASGTVSELVGEQPFLDGTTVGFDLAMRCWGFRKLAKADVEAQAPGTRVLVEAYTQGVNAALEAFMPLEYRLLGITPVPWDVEDSYAIGRLIGFSVTHNWHQEASRLLLALHVGIERAERIYPTTPTPSGRTLRPGGPATPLPPAVAVEIAGLFPPREPGPIADADEITDRLPGTFSGASNAWVVGPGRSASGSPVLANDPHMTHMVPSLMYQEHLHDAETDVIGIAVPGIPFVLAGHNDHVAWGMTSTVADTVDMCIEKTNPDDPGEVLGPDGRWEPVRMERIVVRIRDKSDITDRHFTIRHTRNGPAFNDMYPGLLPRWAPLVTLRRDTSSVTDSIQALYTMAGARTVKGLIEATKGLSTPVNTLTAADTDGTVGVFVSGRVPIRRNHSGAFPIPGWLKKYDWSSFIPRDDLPRGLGTGDTVFVHSNNLMADPTRLRYFIQVDSGPAYRYDRIAELLKAKPKHDMDSLAAIQKDVYLGRAARLTGAMVSDLRKAGDLGEIGGKALDILDSWNFVATADSAAAAIFFLTYREAAMEALADELDARGFAFIMSQRYSTNVADEWITEADHPVWDDRRTPEVEDRAVAMKKAFARALAKLVADQGKDPNEWRWGRLHDLAVRHPFGGKKAISKFVNLKRSEVGGGLDSVWKSHFDLGHPKHPFRAMAGPVWRMVVDLSDIRHARWISDTGASGWPGSPHYRDQHDDWLEGRYVPMVSDWEDIVRDAAGTWTLTP